jgi:hypothetical protein
VHILTFSFAFADLLLKLFFLGSFAIQRSNYATLQQAKFCENECKSTAPLTWYTCWIIVDFLGVVVFACILN